MRGHPLDREKREQGNEGAEKHMAAGDWKYSHPMAKKENAPAAACLSRRPRSGPASRQGSCPGTA